ncbi:hypothetical protein HRbin15_00117 [bacterium HR15]|uniref:Hypothetical conserved protein n=1 Tax=uncultured prokaryote TaxID=198431 RepID=H5SN80_9ZZZZ|nr:hypothetical conserved protein [uncultured prokaryote]GBC91663.1 hypothetical protein HRbin15_00117 [bacterium HR15]
MLWQAIGVVEQIVRERDGVQYLRVRTDTGTRNALNYIPLMGRLRLGEHVLLNTTATTLQLGTGGYDFVMAVLPNQSNLSISSDRPEGWNREHLLVRLRYTPLQFAATAAENLYPDALDGTLTGAPVVAILLHSHLAPVVGAIRYTRPNARIAYIMTDSAALALSFSETVSQLKALGWLSGTITIGQAFGGDLEAVNLYSALLLARYGLHADVIVVGQGPGNLGTGTRWGFSGIDQGLALNAIGTLGGQPIAALRISFSDPRERHHGVSHHSLTVLSQVTLVPCHVPVPVLSDEQMERVLSDLQHAGVADRHTVHLLKAEEAFEWLCQQAIPLTTMGRDAQIERAYFLAGCAAGLLAATLVSGR